VSAVVGFSLHFVSPPYKKMTGIKGKL